MSDVEKVARAICKSGKFECGQGCCAPICMEALGDARRSCQHVVRVHGDLARAALSALGGWNEAPTEEMKLAGARALRESFGWPNQVERAAHCYEAMLALRRPATGEGGQPRKAGE